MGRGGYNGGGPVVKKPKINDVDVFDGAGDTLNLPKDFKIVEAGEGLQNERGGRQAEFGYLICTKKAETNSSTLKLFLHKLMKAKKDEAEYRWALASVLLKDFPLEVRNFHHQTPDAPRPFGLEINEEAKE